MLRITGALKAALPTAQFEETGDRATMSYGTGGTVQLLRQHGVWKIRGFPLSPRQRGEPRGQVAGQELDVELTTSGPGTMRIP